MDARQFQAIFFKATREVTPNVPTRCGVAPIFLTGRAGTSTPSIVCEITWSALNERDTKIALTRMGCSRSTRSR